MHEAEAVINPALGEEKIFYREGDSIVSNKVSELLNNIKLNDIESFEAISLYHIIKKNDMIERFESLSDSHEELFKLLSHKDIEYSWSIDFFKELELSGQSHKAIIPFWGVNGGFGSMEGLDRH